MNWCNPVKKLYHMNYLPSAYILKWSEKYIYIKCRNNIMHRNKAHAQKQSVVFCSAVKEIKCKIYTAKIDVLRSNVHPDQPNWRDCTITATPNILLQCRLAARSLLNSETRQTFGLPPLCASLTEPAHAAILQKEALALILGIKHPNDLTDSISEKQYSKCKFKN